MGECLIIRSGGGTDTSGATATANVILSGYTAYVNDEKVTGTMPVQTLNQTLNPGGSVTLPAGYYEEGANVISASALSDAAAGTAAASHILSGYNAWVNGTNTWGNMPNRGNISHSLPANGTYTVPAGWHAGGGVVNQSLAFHWGGTYTPNTANQVICWANWYAAGNIVVAGNGNLVAGNIRNGITIFGIRGTFTGFVDSSVTVFNGDTGSVSSYFWNWYCGYNGPNYNTNGYAAYIMSGCKNRYDFLMDWVIYLPKSKSSHFVFKVPGVANTTPNGKEFTLYVTSITNSEGSSDPWSYAIWYFSKSYSGSSGSKIRTSTTGASIVQFKSPAITGGHHTEVTTIYNNGASKIGTNWSGWVGVASHDAAGFVTKIIYHP